MGTIVPLVRRSPTQQRHIRELSFDVLQASSSRPALAVYEAAAGNMHHLYDCTPRIAVRAVFTARDERTDVGFTIYDARPLLRDAKEAGKLTLYDLVMLAHQKLVSDVEFLLMPTDARVVLFCTALKESQRLLRWIERVGNQRVPDAVLAQLKIY